MPVVFQDAIVAVVVLFAVLYVVRAFLPSREERGPSGGGPDVPLRRLLEPHAPRRTVERHDERSAERANATLDPALTDGVDRGSAAR
ncbi:MAG: hypothetical protein R3A78_05800 [Polyangiales bacterium]|nr:hypothetical protein [Myxococcales bacterium]